ncbi:SLBB domain-containing protein [candidate division KSB1 bacterium]|nr:SLBB domain-containing protein [candidate division KSB1 bacterium]
MKKALFFIFLMTLVSVMRLWGQEAKTSQRDQPSRYVVGTEEQMLLPVNVLGLVRKPGQYLVPFRTDLISVIAYAGGFRANAKISEIKIVRSAVVESNSSIARVIKVNLKRYFEQGDKTQIPQIMPDDTIIVAGTARQTLNAFMSFVRDVLVVAQLIFIIDRTTRD